MFQILNVHFTPWVFIEIKTYIFGCYLWILKLWYFKTYDSIIMLRIIFLSFIRNYHLIGIALSIEMYIVTQFKPIDKKMCKVEVFQFYFDFMIICLYLMTMHCRLYSGELMWKVRLIALLLWEWNSYRCTAVLAVTTNLRKVFEKSLLGKKKHQYHLYWEPEHY